MSQELIRLDKKYTLQKYNATEDMSSDHLYLYQLAIHDKEYFPLLCKSIIKTDILSLSFIDYETHTFFFHATRAEPLVSFLKKKKSLTYLECVHCIENISKQMIFLKENGYAFSGFDIEDILVVDEDIFMVVCGEYICSIGDFSSLYFYTPFKKPAFSNPELLEISSLPSSIHYRSSYYSLGTLIVFCFFNQYLLVGNEYKTLEEIEIMLDPIFHTKLYWFLKRCFHEHAKQRTLLFI